MSEYKPDTNQGTATPVSLRDNALRTPEPESRPAASRPWTLIIAAFVVGALVMMACAMTTPLGEIALDNNSEDDSLSEAEVRQIVDEAVGTQIAQASVGTSADGSVDSAAVQQMVGDAVGTEVAMLRPTNTPIPPTPTVIPAGVAAEDDAFLGPADAPVVIVEFSDFQCGFCGRWYQDTLPRIREEYPDQVKFVYRDFPIFGEESLLAAMATECAEEQQQDAFWEMHNRLFDRLTNQENTPLNADTMVSYAEDIGLDTDSFRQCLTDQTYFDEVLADFQAAESYGLRGTPGFVINGEIYAIGAQPFDVFRGIIEEKLAEAAS